MRLDRPRRPNRYLARLYSRGIAILSAIFLLLLIAGLIALMVTFMSVSNVTASQDVQGARVYHAARSGVEWGAFQVLRNTSCVAGPTTVTLPAYDGITVEVGCTSTDFDEAGTTIRIHRVVSTARTLEADDEGAVGFIERQLEVTIERSL